MKVKVRDVLKTVEINPPGYKTTLTKYEEVLISCKADIEDCHSVSDTQYWFRKHLQCITKNSNPHKLDNNIK